jgi:hypothetical protein
MLHFNSLVVGLVAAISIAAPAQAFSPVISPVEISKPDSNLQAEGVTSISQKVSLTGLERVESGLKRREIIGTSALRKR